MFNLTYTQESEVKGKIQFKSKPQCLGPAIDVHGKVWDIRGLFYLQGGNYVWACPKNEVHPYYYDTSGSNHGVVSQKWDPYEVEVVNV